MQKYPGGLQININTNFANKVASGKLGKKRVKIIVLGSKSKRLFCKDTGLFVHMHTLTQGSRKF